jgi:hypothetical protein
MKLFKPLPVLLAASLTCTLIACNNAAEPATNQKVATTATADLKEVYYTADSTAGNNNPPQTPTTRDKQIKQDWDKKIIRNATLSVEVKSYKAFSELLRTSVKQLGGYIAQEQQNQGDYKIESIVTIKVPVDQFDNAITQLTPAAEKIVEKKITAEDVTGEVIDTKSRMEAKKKVRDRYLDLLKQAKNMEEILQVQNEINDIQEQIESAAGRVDYLTHASACSTINLGFYQVLNPGAVNNTEPSFGTRIVLSFKSGLQWFGELLVLLISLWPLWIGIATLWMIIRRYRPAVVKNPK